MTGYDIIDGTLMAINVSDYISNMECYEGYSNAQDQGAKPQ